MLFWFRSASAEHNEQHQAGQKYQADEELQQDEQDGELHFDQMVSAVLHMAGIHTVQLHPEDLADRQSAVVEETAYLAAI